MNRIDKKLKKMGFEKEYENKYGAGFYRKDSNLYFESGDKLKEAIETVGKERVKKYYLGVRK